MPARRTSILKRSRPPEAQPAGARKKRKAEGPGPGSEPGKGVHPSGSSRAPPRVLRQPASSGGWRCCSTIDHQAADVVHKVLSAKASQRHGVSVKALCLAPHVKHMKATYAVACETLKHLKCLKAAVEATGLLRRHAPLSLPVALVLAYELLLGQGLGGGQGQGPAERAVAAAGAALRAAHAQLVAEEDGAASPSRAAWSPEGHRRCARVNTLKMSREQALAWLRKPPDKHAHAALAEIEVDDLLPDVLLFPPKTDLHEHPLVRNGTLVLQSKASCMPARALNPEPGWDIIDACAAPGNKTTHLAALTRGAGRIFAFDRDPKRATLLRRSVKACGAANVSVRAADFLLQDLATSPEFAGVRAILLGEGCGLCP